MRSGQARTIRYGRRSQGIVSSPCGYHCAHLAFLRSVDEVVVVVLSTLVFLVPCQALPAMPDSTSALCSRRYVPAAVPTTRRPHFGLSTNDCFFFVPFLSLSSVLSPPQHQPVHEHRQGSRSFIPVSLPGLPCPSPLPWPHSLVRCLAFARRDDERECAPSPPHRRREDNLSNGRRPAT